VQKESVNSTIYSSNGPVRMNPNQIYVKKVTKLSKSYLIEQ